MPKHSAHEEQLQQGLMEELRAPEVRKLCKPGKGGSVFSRFDEIDLMFLSNDELAECWAELGADLDDLARLLQEWPHLIDVDLIRKQLFHLSALARGSMPMSDFLTRKGRDKQEAARKKLKLIAQGLMRGLLPPASIGRPRTINYHTLLKDLKKLLVRLDYFIRQDSFLLMRKRDESQSQFAHRISELILRLYESAFLSFQFTNSADQPVFDDNGHLLLERLSLDLPQAKAIAERVVGRRRKVSWNALILGILEFHYQLPRTALENHLARAKEADRTNLIEALRIDFPRFARHL